MKRIAINGLGRIGKLVLLESLNRKEIVVVGINDLIEPDYMAYMLKYDSTHGRFKGEVSFDENHLIVNGRKIRVTNKKDPNELLWGELDVDIVMEATGHFLTKETAQGHINAGAKRVLMTGPSKDDTPMFVMGVNHTKLTKDIQMISNASCTTNCLAPLAKLIQDNFGIEEALMTTVHSVTATQRIVDGLSSKDWRGGRAGLSNIIPSSTGAAKAVGLIIPELNGKITGMAFRVPTLDVSVVDLTVRLTASTSYEDIKACIKKASENEMKGIVGYTEDDVVSSDMLGMKETCIFDAKAGIMLNPNFVKLVGWYDNEIGYSNKLLDLVEVWG
ncbi:MAG: type I glyceraldehyde-3-phosphate dehydrogenase [Chitinophagales bacterium]|jgi:glyceraldehyde 3-phosphate dehydrogenase|nr:type I glyceraldehyde-3-phosphate dehydrogenase [Sphingobacteriales bacterium]